MRIDGAGLLKFLGADLTNHAPRHSHDDRSRRNAATLRDHRAGGNNAFGPDFAARQQTGADPDQGVPADHFAVQHRAVPDHHAFLNRLRAIGVRVLDAAVLEVNARHENDGGQVAPHHAIEPDVDARMEKNFPRHDGAVRHVVILNRLHVLHCIIDSLRGTGMKPTRTSVFFFPFDLFGSGGTAAGVRLLADAFREMLADNRRERVPTRARAYARKVRVEEFTFDNLAAYQDWRDRARRSIRKALNLADFLFWITGNHLGVLPVYDELSVRPPSPLQQGRTQRHDTTVIQFDAHLDIYNLTDCTPELSHGNYLLHCDGPLPPIINVGHRELLLRPDYIAKYFRQAHGADAIALDPEKT